MSDALLRKILELSGGVNEDAYVLALDGELLREVPEVMHTHRGPYPVVRPASELGLRRVVQRMGTAPFIGLLPQQLAERLPPDLVLRGRGARVVSVNAQDALVMALGTQVIGADAQVTQLAIDHLPELQARVRQGTLPTVIDARLLDELLLDVCVDARIRSDAPGKLLARWVRELPRGDRPVMELLRRTLPTLHAVAGRILAWALAEPRRLEALVVHGCLLEVPGELPKAVWGLLEPGRRETSIGLEEDAFRKVVFALAAEALEALGPDAVRFQEQAQTIARTSLRPSELERCSLLPLGLDTLCERLAKKAAKGEAVIGAEVDEVRRHRCAKQRAPQVAVVEELGRLSRWLAQPAAESAEVTRAMRQYQESGAFADLSVLRLRRALAQTEHLQTEGQKLLTSWREKRDAENRAFAGLLAQGYLKALHSQGVIPLHRVWSDLVQPEAGPVFAVVLDGCSYPVFLELLEELAGDAAEPLGLLETQLEQGRAHGRPALSLLPTITSHARGAFFLGEFPKDPLRSEMLWREEEERRTDPARFKQNAALKSRTRRLFLKGDLADGGAALKDALRDSKLEVVAAVFNAVDDEIGSSNTGKAFHLEARHITGLLPSLRVALAAGRRVLVTADHGHSPYVSRELRVGDGATPRWCELGEGQSAPEGFLEINLEGHGGTPGRKAFAWKVGAYLGGPQVGFHGGCGLEEMVVPMAWLGTDGVAADAPLWWFGRGEAPVVEPARSKPARSTRREPVVAEEVPVRSQSDLFDAHANLKFQAAGVEALGLSPEVVRHLDANDRAVLVLLAQVGSARAVDLATKLGRPPSRMGPVMTNLNRKLHRLGVTLFRTVALSSGDIQYEFVPVDGGGRS